MTATEGARPDTQDTTRLIAYVLPDAGPVEMPVEIVPAPAHREWMAATTEGFARRCLPMIMANQAEWWLLNTRRFAACWGGGRSSRSLTITYDPDEDGATLAASHFGHGILTFVIPVLFRTPPGWNLGVRGPANRPKDAIAPLSGLVETDWVSATFTMNWQFTRPHTEVIFDRGEPMCAVTPQRRGELAAWEPQVTAMGDVEKAPYEAFRDGRSRWAEEKLVPGTPASTQLFARHYMHGESEDGMRFDFHERKLRLKRFAGRPETEPPSGPAAETYR